MRRCNFSFLSLLVSGIKLIVLCIFFCFACFSFSLARSLLCWVSISPLSPRLHPLRVPTAQKVLSRKKALLDRNLTYSTLPKSYSTNNVKEETLLEYVEDFRRQFVTVFPTRRALTLAPMNECGVRKFICSTIHPTLLPYNDVYDMKECAEFVADYLKFIPLDEPTKLPDLVASTSTMLQVRSGDCLDLSIFLVSLLRGAGYNAYCVSGYAPEWITQADQSEVVCPLLPDQVELARKKKEEEEKKKEDAKYHNKYAILARPEHKSRYRAARIQEQEDIARQAIEDEEARVRKLKEKAADLLHGERAHSWVLVSRGRRELTEELFIEPTTGTIYPVSKSPYFQVDAVWNETNYWVNVQAHLSVALPIQEMSWDLSIGKDWEYVLIDERKYRESALARHDIFGSASTSSSSATANTSGGAAGGNTNSNKFDSGKDGNNNSGTGSSGGKATEESKSHEHETPPEEVFDDRDILDAPISWTNPIVIDRDSYLARYPGNYKFIQFKDCTLEKWSPYAKGRVGLVRKIQIYLPNKTMEVRLPILIECWENFAHRKDKLYERHTYPLESRCLALYSPGLLSGLKSYQWIDESQRFFEFYPGARVDGMVFREELAHTKIIERYEARDDFLHYRSIAVDSRPLGARGQKVTFLPLGPKSIEFPIRKLTEKYNRNLKIPAEADIAKRTHFLTQNTIRLDFHYGKDHITHSTHLLDKNDKLEQSETEGRQIGSVGSLLRVDPTWKERSRGEEQQMVAKLLFIEKDLKLKLKAREEAIIKETIKLDEELNDVAGKIILEKSIYDVAYEQAKLVMEGSDSSERDEEADRASANKVDYLSPFLAQYPSHTTKPLTRRQAQQAKDECLATLKERLLERANIIQQHLDEETSKLHQRQSLQSVAKVLSAPVSTLENA
jgi:hypothetical protein